MARGKATKLRKNRNRKQPDLSIVIPAFSEEKRIGKTLDELARFLKNDKRMKKLWVEVVVVAAGNLDKTRGIVQKKIPKFSKLLIVKPDDKVGKGRDVKLGMLKTKGSYIVFMDADLATPLHHLPIFYKLGKDGADIVVGTRNIKINHPNPFRRVMSNLGNILFRLAGGVRIEDSQCGFKMFNRQAVKVCFERMTITGWGFDMEILAIAKANHFKIKPVRINDWVDVPGGTFNDGLFKNYIDSLRDLIKITFNRVIGKYN